MNPFSLRKSSTEFDLKVIEQVKARPMLWDTRHVDYKCSERKPLEWQQIGEELNMDAGVVRKRFDNIRGALRRSLIRMSKWNNKPVGVKPQPYKYSAELEFIFDFVNQDKVYESVTMSDDCDSEMSRSDVDDSVEGPSKRIKLETTPEVSSAAVDNSLVHHATSRYQSNAWSHSHGVSADETADDDWLFVRRMYNKLRAIPDGREKEMFKCRVDTELVNLLYV